MQSRKWLWSAIVAVLFAPMIAFASPSGSAAASLTPSADEVTYKEYFVPHTQFTGSCSSPTAVGGYWYVEPSPCAKTLTFSIPDDASGALRAEIYLDLWRNRDVPKLRFRLNDGLLRDPGVGSDWGRTPYLGDVPLTELRQGTNTIELTSSAPVHVHDISIRVYHDATHPLVAGSGSDVTPPTGSLTSVVASNGTFSPTAGGSLNVDNDQLTFTANAVGARYVDFLGYYDGYDIDADGVTTEWQSTGRNNWFPGGRSAQSTGGLINHLGSDATSPYQVTWSLPHVKNQAGVKFKVRLVDAAGNVREAAGGVSAPFTLTRSDTLEYYRISDFEDAVLHHDGLYPDEIVRSINLPDMTGVISARLLGNFWNNPKIELNGNTTLLRAFASGADQWKVSDISLPLTLIGEGANTIKYSYSGSGFGEFVEKPGPMIVLRRRITNPQPPTITAQPSSVAVTENVPAVLSVSTSGSPLITYQWYRDGVAISGATSSSYTTPRLGPDDAGSNYTLVATNRFGAATSAPMPVVVRPAAPWWNTTWPYRLDVNVNTAGVARTNKTVDAQVNFTDVLNGLGEPGRLDPNTIRVVEIDDAGTVIDDNIRYQFDGASSYNDTTNARGTLVFEMDGATPSDANRRFQVYFAKTGSGIGPFVQDYPLTVVDNVFDEGQDSFRISTPTTTWFYQKQGAGFSSLLDVAGRDWLSYRPNVAGSGGTFRGIPNSVYPDGQFHPGATGSTTTLLSSGPLKATLRSETVDGQWVIQWEIYLTYARGTVLRAPRAYWFLYEGTPGGSLSYSNDIVIRSNGTQNTAGSSWQADLTGDEWVLVGDVPQARSIFVAQQNPDNAIDSYRPMEGNMTVLGFGRRTNDPQLRSTGNAFTVGLIDTVTYPTAKQLIDDRYKPLGITVGLGELVAGPVLPGAPTDVTAVAGSASATVTWGAPVVTGGKPLTGYVITPSGGGTPISVDGTTTSTSMTGLTNGQAYTFTVRASTSAGPGPESAPSAPITPSPNVALVSDDFNSRTLRPDWTLVDPVGDSEALLTGNELVLRVPGGRSHDLWTNALLAPQVLQPVANVDFQTVLKYEGAPSQVYQMQGFVAKQDDRNFARFDMLFAPASGYPNGVLKISGSAIVDGVGELQLEALAPAGTTRFLRITRSGQTWTLEYSSNGDTWIPAGDFDMAINVRQVGPFAGNHADIAANTPQFISRLDYIFNTSYPISPEDAVADTAPVAVSEFAAAPSETRFVVSFRTDQLATAIVDYGLTPAYELGSSTASAIDTRHRIVIAGLDTSTQYYYRVRVADVRATTAEISDQAITTLAEGVGGSIVSLWYGLTQYFGFIGQPQRWVNVLGNVSDVDGIAVASFRLNGGTDEFLQVGNDDRRLSNLGDFNVEIAATRLLRGLNTLTITFTDLFGNTTTSTVDVVAEQGRTWPLPYNIDWDNVSDISDVAQVVDGKWKIENGELRTVELGYDRLIAIGDIGWTDYEITVPITPHSKDDAGYAFPSSGPAIGLLLRWPGHYTVDDRQPSWGYSPLGALGWYRFQTNGTNKLVLSDGDGLNDVSAPSTFQLQFGTTYVFKMRVQTVSSGANPGQLYTLSVWEQGQPEQSGTTISSLQPLTAQQNGSALLVAHHVDASFGDISVARINPAMNPTVTPAGGVYTAGQTVSMTSPDAAARIYYTVDGSEPTTSSKVYTAPFILNVDATVKAISVREDLDTSGVVSSSYFIRKATPIQSDDFSAAQVNSSVWTLIDPQDDALPFTSKTSTDARLNLFVPAGRSHDLFDTRLLAPRLLQAAPNDDFDIRAKFQGTYSGTFTMQGLIAQQTFKDFVRVDVYRSGSARRVYAATFVNGIATTRLDVPVTIGTSTSPDVLLRLRRTGDQFTVYWSADGITWTSAGSFTHPTVISAVGAWTGSHTGTGATSAAMTGIIDYFESATAPLVGEDAVLPANIPPAVNAGPDLETRVEASPSLLIRSNVADDQLPTNQLTYNWNEVFGPGTPIFGATAFESNSVVKAGVAFDVAGLYRLELCASDGSFSTCDQFNVRVSPAVGAPSVDAGRGGSVTVGAVARLRGTVSDDGLPQPTQITWTQIQGPTPATIATPSAAASDVTFAERGDYVFRLSATDGQFTSSDLVEFKVVDPRSTIGLRALWDFADGAGTVIADVSGVDTPLDLHISNASRVTWGAGLTLNQEVQIASHEPATKISAPISASGEYTIEAWIRPKDLTQYGPARIAGISNGSTSRNVTLGQGFGQFQTGDKLDLRTRSTSTTANGTPEVTTASGLNLGLNHVVATRSVDGTTTVWVNGVVVGTGVIAGDLSNWDTTMPFVIANEVGGGRAWLGEYRLVAVYDRALTPPQIASQYQHGPTVIAPNLPPVLEAGNDQVVIFPSPVNLQATVSDDGRPSRSGALTEWSTVSGPGTVTFGNKNAAATTATFSQPGVYELQITADDGDLTTTDNLIVTVSPQPPNVAPVVDVGPDTLAVLGSTRGLTGVVIDDGLPIPPASYTVSWSKVSGPGDVVFSSPSAQTTNVGFTATGQYVLRLTADDGGALGTDDLVVDVRRPNRVDTDLVGMWTFSEGSGNVVRDVSDFGAPLDLQITQPSSVTWTTDGLQVDAPTVIRSAANATKITNAVKASNEFTLEAWIDPKEISPASQGRIVSIAGNSNAWNVAFGQGFYDGYATNLFRARVGTTSTTQPFATASVPSADLTHVVVTRRADRQQTMFVNGVQQHSVKTAGDLSNWQDFPVFLANESGLNRPWQGTYRLVAFQDRQLTADEVMQNFLAGPTPNARPSVSVEPDRTVEVGVSVALSASATDDGLPDPPAELNLQWRMVSGPATPVFTTPAQATTNVTLPVAGTYVLALEANDGALTGSDQITIVAAVNTAPSVSAGPDATVEFATPITLNGTAGDDALPVGSTLSNNWTLVSGPGTASIANSTSMSTAVTVTLPGQYEFRLGATDGALTSSDTVTLFVVTNAAPVVDAGPNIATAVNRAAQLNGAASDDGLPSGSALTNTWSKVSGPGAVTFDDPALASTTASFSSVGTYVLELASSDGAVTTRDTVTVEVSPAITPPAPAINPGGGSFVQSVVVNAAPSVPGATLRYTVDGSDPTDTSTQLIGGLVVTASTTVKVRSFSPSDPPSDVATAAFTITSSARVATNLAALYRFDEGSGTKVYDVAGGPVRSDLDLDSPAGGTWVPGAISLSGGAALRTTGPASSIIAPLKATNELTVEAWITPSAVSTTPGQIVNLGVSQTDRNVQLSQGFWDTASTSMWDVRLRTTTSNNNTMTSGSTAVQPSLTHVVYTRAANGAVRLYVDGVQVGSGGAGGTLANWNDTVTLMLGNRPEGGGGWSGRYHLVAFYNRALSATEVGQNNVAGPEG